MYGGSVQFLPGEFELLPQLVKRFITPRKLALRDTPSPSVARDSLKTTRKIPAKVRLGAEILG